MLLNVPPPEMIDHAPVIPLPPMLAPLKVIAPGDADWHTLFGPPAVAVGNAFTVTICVIEFVQPLPFAAVV